MRTLAGDKESPILVSAHALEAGGINAIPDTFAGILSKILGWEHSRGVVQTNVVSHTGSNGYGRLARPAYFDGTIESGRNYVLVDDFFALGGTLANLKGHIETNGGHVIGAVSLTGKNYSAKLKVSKERLDELRNKHP
ncbi:MAG: phosphoribosyltransferase [Methylococcaceae bacterium]